MRDPISIDARVAAELGTTLTLLGAPVAKVAGLVMLFGVTAVGEVTITGCLIGLGGSLITLGGSLIALGRRLIGVGCRLVGVRVGLITISEHLIALGRARRLVAGSRRPVVIGRIACGQVGHINLAPLAPAIAIGRIRSIFGLLGRQANLRDEPQAVQPTS